ncbi:MAG: tetratricopeptide repeat protein, partial [Candidatus Eisenbacteria bacterium]|nr:tetratricopeptide repeat protein [Candidatus Eisenbacteria bacterium]
MQRILLVVSLLLAAGPVWADSDGMMAAEDRVWELRSEARYSDARDLARELVALAEADSTACSYEVDDAKRLVETLDKIIALPKSQQRELSEADGLDPVLLSLWDAARYDEGVEAARRQLGIRRRILGELSVDVSESLNELGLFLGASGDYPAAERTLREALTIDKVTLGESHPDLAMGLCNLGLMMHYGGDDRNAERPLREALLIQRISLGEDHPDFRFSLNNLAIVLSELGEYAEAEALLRQSVVLHRRLDGGGARELPIALRNLAAQVSLQGDVAEAEMLYREALEAARGLYGPDHPETAYCLNGLGVFMVEESRYAEADTLLKESLRIQREVHGDRHPDVAAAMLDLGSTLVKRGDHDEGTRLIRDALSLFIEIEGDSHPNVALAFSTLSSALQRQGRFAEAESAIRRTVEIRRAAYGELHPGVAGARQSLGVLLWWQGKTQEAELVLEAAARGYDASRLDAGARMKRATFRLQSPYRFLAAVRLELGRPEDAWQAAERAVGRSIAELMIQSRLEDSLEQRAVRIDSLSSLVGRLEQELSAYAEAERQVSATAAAEAVVRTRDRLMAAEAELVDLRREAVDAGLTMEVESLPLERVGASLGSGCAIIGSIDLPWRFDEIASWGYVVRSPGVVHWAFLGRSERGKEGSPLSNVNLLVRDLRDADSSSGGIRYVARKLWDQRFAPLLSYLDGVRELVLVPTGTAVG